MKNFQHNRQVAIRMLLDWLESHVEQFRPLPGEGLNSFTHIKPLGELALILYSLKAPSAIPQSADIRLWSDDISEKLVVMTEMWGADIDWENLPDLVHRSPEIVSALLIFPVVSKVSGQHSRWLPQVKKTFLQLHGNSGEVSVDVLFAQDLAGLEKCSDTAIVYLLNGLKKPVEISMQTSTLYLMTHYIFFAAEMGHRLVSLSEKEYNGVCSYLDQALEQTLLQSNYDLMAEILMCMHQLKAGHTASRRAALVELVKVILQTGWIPGNHDGKIRSGNAFHQHYHACLMGLSALGTNITITELN